MFELSDDLACESRSSAASVGADIEAFGVARAEAGVVMATLLAAGFTAADFPQLCASLDADGSPVVVIGAISDETARRLCGPPGLIGAVVPPEPDDGHAA